MTAQAQMPVRTKLPDGNHVSTVYMREAGGPGWYATRVFSRIGELRDWNSAATEAQARVNHDAMVAKWSAHEERKP